jgi:ubiquinone/menaquinone biosynthesis C-methylase UbiE
VVVRRPSLWPVFRPLLRTQFDRLASEWDAMRGPDALAPYEAALARVNGDVRDVLDVGTGTGAGARALARHFVGAKITGIDVAPAMVEEARRLLPPDVTDRVAFRIGDAAKLPFEARAFDLVAHANMIPFLDEVARVLRPGGWTLFAFSSGSETPIYVAPERLRRELERRGFTDFAEIAAGRGSAVLARRGNPH